MLSKESIKSVVDTLSESPVCAFCVIKTGEHTLLLVDGSSKELSTTLMGVMTDNKSVTNLLKTTVEMHDLFNSIKEGTAGKEVTDAFEKFSKDAEAKDSPDKPGIQGKTGSVS